MLLAYKRPRCLKGINLENFPIAYRSAQSSWMNASIFEEYLLSFNNEMKKKNRNSLLILDNCSAHVLASRKTTLSNVKIIFIRPNLTSVLQPCDAGIIRSFKAIYRKVFLEEMCSRIHMKSITKVTVKKVYI